MRIWPVVLLVSSLISIGPAVAQDTTTELGKNPSPEPSAPQGQTSPPPTLPGVTPEARAAATELMRQAGAIDTGREILSGMRAQMIRLMVQSGKIDQDRAAKAVDDLILPELKTHLPELVDIQIELVASIYTVDEMRQLAGFYATPLGQKALQAQVQMTTKMAAAGSEWGRRVVVDAIRKHADELRQRGVKL